MKFTRKFTKKDIPIRKQVEWKTVDAKIPGANFEMSDVIVPKHWSETATNILAQKYFRKAGVPRYTLTVQESGVPNWLCPKIPAAETSFGSEFDANDVFHRLVGHWTYVGFKNGYFDNKESAEIFYDEIYWMLAHQYAAPNSPQWFNTGLWWAYGIVGPAAGQWAVDGKGNPFEISNSYEYPQPHACFIQPIADDLVNSGGIMDLWTREVRLFKYGSGTGTNFSSVRGRNEPLSGGGKSSGLMSFLEIGDRAAGAIKSGGTTRRAAKMVICDLDHPDIEEFIDWKVNEEYKAAAMYVGSRVIREGILPGIVPDQISDRFRNGIDNLELSIDWEGEAIRSVSGQNSNNSVRIADAFMTALKNGETWQLKERTTGKVVKEIPAKDLWHKICRAAWASADPGVQFDDTINEWHTCKADGRINASNPCSEYMFLDNTACNLASINLVKAPGTRLDWSAFHHVVRLWTVVLDISITMASYPSREIAEGSYNYRTLGLGYANLGGLLMRKGIAYDSTKARTLAGQITSYMTSTAYIVSADMASELEPFPRWQANQEYVRSVMVKHETEASQFKNAYPRSPLRNAQVTLLAPTGTISFIMDCDTSGIEPLYALSAEKSLAGGGKIFFTNESLIEESLKSLGYKFETRGKILEEIKQKGDVGLLNSSWLKPNHLSVFSCAVGENALEPMAHIDMVASVQPFLSGAVSKTINLPSHYTVEDISHIYMEAYRSGLKSVALYRDGCKLNQPLKKSMASQETAVKLSQNAVSNAADIAEKIAEELKTEGVENPTKDINRILRGGREELLPRRNGYTQKFKIDGQTLYLRTGEYEDGRLGEIFVNMSKEGSTARAIMEAWAKAISIGLQFGVPLSEYVEAFLNVKFEPAGFVQGHDRVKICSSPVDLIMRDLGVSYLQWEDLAQVEKQSVKVHHELTSGGGEIQTNGSPETIHVSEIKFFRSGEFCPECGGEMKISGACKTCIQCGATTGCG